jgi:hypothetical protein
MSRGAKRSSSHPEIASDSSAPVPKADSGLAQKCSIFSGFYFNEMQLGR